MPVIFLLFVAVLGLATPRVEAAVAAWPAFRGLHRSGVAWDGGFPLDFGPETNVMWGVPFPGAPSSPVVWEHHLYLTGLEQGLLTTFALDASTGRLEWKAGVEPGRTEPGSRLSHPAAATPVTDGRLLIAYFAPFGLVAYDRTGREVWRHRIPTPVTQHGASSSPVLAGDLVLQVCDQDAGSFVLALDKASGTVRWKTERPEFRRGFSTPLPWPPEAPEEVVVAGTLRLVAYGLDDGAEHWSVRGLPNEMVASPVGGDGWVYVAGWTYGAGVPRMPAWDGLAARGDQDHDGELTREEAPAGPARQQFAYMDADRNGRVTREEYEAIATIFNASSNAVFAVRPGGRGDVTASRIEWRQSRGLPYVPSPLFYEGRLYLVKNGGLASCLDARTGKFWYQEERMGAGALGDYYSSPVAGGGRIVAISQAGMAVVYRAGDTFEVLRRNALGEPVLATPAIVDGVLYVRTAGHLYAFADRQPDNGHPAGGRHPAEGPGATE